MELEQLVGNTDIYLIDLLLKKRLQLPLRMLDAGCGGGRNLDYFLRSGCDVYGVDMSAGAIRQTQRRAHRLAPRLPDSNFRVESIEQLGFGPGRFPLIICSAVLHFARDRAHFESMLSELWRVLAPGGILFVRTASRQGFEEFVEPLGGGRFSLPDGSGRFLVDADTLTEWTRRRGASLLEPLKTVLVSGLRAMATWVVVKEAEQ